MQKHNGFMNSKRSDLVAGTVYRREYIEETVALDI